MITVCIPSIPPRAALLELAIASVDAQTLEAEELVVAYDIEKQGAPRTRQRTLDRVTTPLVAFLDDDDEFYPQHLQRLYETLVATDSDLVFPWFDVVGGSDPFPTNFGKEFDCADPVQVPITFLAKTSSVRAAGGFVDGVDETNVGTDSAGNRAGEDYRLIVRMCGLGMKITHLPERTWQWNHASGNTSGRSDRW